jgi:low affinity Fe/Cu permease
MLGFFICSRQMSEQTSNTVTYARFAAAKSQLAQRPECFQIFWTGIAVVDVVSVFPQIASDQWFVCVVSGVAAFDVLTISSTVRFFTSQSRRTEVADS